MPTLDDFIVSVSGRLTHQWDFTFYKNNGDIANRIRADLGSSFKEMTIDGEGDIDLRTEVSHFYATPAGIIAGGWLTETKRLLAAPQGIEDFTKTIEIIVKHKGSFALETYSVRLFFRFTPENSLKLLGARGLESVLQSILGDKAPSDVKSFKFSARHDRGKFSDLIELETSLRDVQLRYSCDANGTDFDSYRAFLVAVDFTRLIEDIRPFAEGLIAAQPQLLGRGLLGRKKTG